MLFLQVTDILWFLNIWSSFCPPFVYFNLFYYILSVAGKPPKFEARKMQNKSTESERPLVISGHEYEIEPLPLHQELMISKSMSLQGNSNDDFGSIRQTKSNSMPSRDTFDDEFVYTRKSKGKKSLPGRSRVRVYTYQVIAETLNGCWFLFLIEAPNSVNHKTWGDVTCFGCMAFYSGYIHEPYSSFWIV